MTRHRVVVPDRPLGYIGWRAGVTYNPMPESTTVYPPPREYKFGYCIYEHLLRYTVLIMIAYVVYISIEIVQKGAENFNYGVPGC